MNTVIFLGAGASKADNAPLQKDLFKEYFSALRSTMLKIVLSKDLLRIQINIFNTSCAIA